MPTTANIILAWLLTYALHSTVLLAAAAIASRSRRVTPSFADVIWKTALVGGILTATAQSVVDRRPAGSFAIPSVLVAQGDPSVAFEPVGAESQRRIEGTEPAPADGSVSAAREGAPTTAGVQEGARPQAGSIRWPILVAVGWIVVALALVLWYLGRRLVLVGRLGDRRPVEAGELTALLDTLCRETGIRSYVHLTTSSAISSPVALGNGEICLPSAALVELEPAQQRAMLAHELAHLVRRDPQWLALSCVVERAFFFQPLNRVARRGIQESAELCADEWAARHSGGVPLARALVKVAEWLQASPLGVPVAGFAEERSQLTRRVSRLLESGALASRPSRAMAVAVASFAILLTAAFAPGVTGRAGGSVVAGGPLRGAEEEPLTTTVELGEPSSPSESATPEPTPGPTPTASVPMTFAPQAAGTLDGPIGTSAVVDTAIVRAVMARLKDEVADVRQAAAEALGRLRHAMAVPALVDALDDEDGEVRRAALHALANYERGVPAAPIRRLLTSDDEEMRYAAIEILTEARDRQSIPAFMQMLGDASEEVRHQVLHALDELEAPMGEDVLGRALEDPAADVRETAAQIAGDRQVTAMVPRLIRLLDDRNGSVREQSAHALTEMRTEASHAALRKAMTHADASVRRIAVEYFGSDPDK